MPGIVFHASAIADLIQFGMSLPDRECNRQQLPVHTTFIGSDKQRHTMMASADRWQAEQMDLGLHYDCLFIPPSSPAGWS